MAKATTIDEYLASLPDDRRAALETLRKVIKRNLGKGYEEGMQYGMIGYYVPHSVYPAGYHCDPKQPLPFASIASQKNHLAIYLMCIYGSEEHQAWFRKAWTDTGKRLDMGKACVRFKKIEDVPLEVLGQAIKRVPSKAYISHYESNLAASRSRPAAKPAGAKRAATKPAPAKAKTPAKRVVKQAAPKPIAPTPVAPKPVAPKPAAPKKVTPKKAAPKNVAHKPAVRRS